MKKILAGMLCLGMVTTGFVAGRMMDHNTADQPHQIQYFVDRIEEGEWLVVEVYDQTTGQTIMVDIKAEEGYKVTTGGDWINTK